MKYSLDYNDLSQVNFIFKNISDSRFSEHMTNRVEIPLETFLNANNMKSLMFWLN